jgi:hypothetical protein
MKRSLVLAAVLAALSSTAVLAYSYSGITISSTVGSYSPDTISGQMGWDSIHNELMVKAFNFRWSATKKTTLVNMKNNDDYYYTIDLAVNNDDDTTVDATSNYYTDLPGPHFDLDDDGGFLGLGNGFNDEAEVTMLTPNDLVANQNYQFITYWMVSNTSGTTFEWTSQKSVPQLGEYNVVNFDSHFSKTFPWW